MNKVLWICGRLPSPLFSGDALYSAGLMKAAAALDDVSLTIVGTRRTDQPIGRHILNLPRTTCIDLPPPRTSGAASLLTPLPKDAYNLSTPEFKSALAGLLQQDWDWIVIDHAYSAGALSIIERDRRAARICYVAHNIEGVIRPQIASEATDLLRKFVMQVDAEKYRRLENRILKVADVIACITDDDAAYFRRFSANVHVVPPVYSGKTVASRAIDSNCPRALLLLGSFAWVAKQRNLELIVDHLFPRLQQHDITLHVAGDAPPALQDRYDRFRPHLVFHGRVDDLSGLLTACRGGLVADLLGGGFKLKVLDYGFQRLPIFGLRNAVAGTTAEEQSAMLLADSLDDLTSMIISNIDQLDALNQKQSAVFDLFSARFGADAASRQLSRILVEQRGKLINN